MLPGPAITSGSTKCTSSSGTSRHASFTATQTAVVGAGDHPNRREILADDAKGVVPAGVVDDDDIPSLQRAEAPRIHGAELYVTMTTVVLIGSPPHSP